MNQEELEFAWSEPQSPEEIINEESCVVLD